MMTSLTAAMVAMVSGFLAGCIHVFSGPDHLAAVAPLSVERRNNSPWKVGVRWGLGHASGVLLVGFLALMLRGVLPIDSLSSWAECLVGVVLIGIGLWGFRKAMTQHLHTHEHTHEGHSHVHIHVHGQASAHPQAKTYSHAHTHTAMAIGTLHGLAGSSHVLGILPALAFPTHTLAVTYLTAYGLGTIGAMAAFSSLIGFVAGGTFASGNRLYRGLMFTCSGAALLIGAFWLVA